MKMSFSSMKKPVTCMNSLINKNNKKILKQYNRLNEIIGKNGTYHFFGGLMLYSIVVG